MKNKILPLSLVTLVVCLGAFLISATVSFPDSYEPYSGDDQDSKAIKASEQYLAKLRNNQVSGLLNPADVINAREQADKIAAQNGNREDLEWSFLGPDNVGGRTRALIFDNSDATSNTIIAGAVSGGLYKTTNVGLTWVKINGEESNLNVSCMAQGPDGTIYVGTGEGFTIQDYSVFGNYGYQGAFVGTGIYKSTNGENFTLIETTTPVDSTGEWSYINKIVVEPTSGAIFVATNTGLRYSMDQGASWSTPNYRHDTIHSRIYRHYTIHSDSLYKQGNNYSYTPNDSTFYPNDTTLVFDSVSSQDIYTIPMNGYCDDISVNAEGKVIVGFNNYCYIANDITSSFINVSINPINYDSIHVDSTVTWISRYVSNAVVTATDTTAILNPDTLIFTYDSIVDIHGWDRIDDNKISSDNLGRITTQFSANDPNVVYASVVKSNGKLDNIYRSDDHGNSWWIVAPGGSDILTFFSNGNNEGIGNYANTLAVFPNNTDRILIGGIDMWEGKKINETGYYQWTQKSSGLFPPQFFPSYVQSNHHLYTFRPGVANQLFVGHDGGISEGNINSELIEFIERNKTYTTSQFSTIGIGGTDKGVIGGAHSAGVQYINGHGNPASAKNGNQIWGGLPPSGGNGGEAFISVIDPLVFIYTQVPGQNFRRSEDMGENFSTTFLSASISIPDDAYKTPCLYWESFENEYTRDSTIFTTKTELASGTEVKVHSMNKNYPFPYTLPIVMNPGDTIDVKDIVSSKFFIGTNDAVWMTLKVLDFTAVEPEWFKIAAATESGFEGQALSMGMSDDANYVFVGTLEGELYRIANIKFAYDFERADVSSPYCVISTSKIDLPNANGQVVTSVCVDPQNPANVVVTLGNYGNDHYVYRTSNGLDEFPTFVSAQGNLPKMPVYSSVIEMTNSNTTIIGTDMGMYISYNINEASPSWALVDGEIGKVPVFDLKQQLVAQNPVQVKIFNGVDTIVVTYPGTENFGVLYAAAYGRGLHISKKFEKPVGIFTPEVVTQPASIKVFPNPVNTQATIEYSLDEKAEIMIAVFDINGKMVISEYISQAAGTHQYKLECSSLPTGTYITSVHTGQAIKTGKFIVIH